MKDIYISVVEADQQRYETVGDWYCDGDDLEIVVTDQGDWCSNFLIALHEMIEAALCLHRGISEESVTKFDEQYEKNRQEVKEHLDNLEYDDPPGYTETLASCGCEFYAEPGDDPHAPYQREHQFAETIERLLANELGVDWGSYLKTIKEE